jgi:hypothetical protein
MSAVVHERVLEQLDRLRLRYLAERLDAVLSEAARTEPTYLDFLDTVLREETAAKQRTRVTMGLKIAHFPAVKTLDDFDFKFQPSVDQRLVRELATGWVWPGATAKELGLVDTLGNYADAVAVAGRAGGLGDDPRVIEYDRTGFFGALERALGAVERLSVPGADALGAATPR